VIPALCLSGLAQSRGDGGFGHGKAFARESAIAQEILLARATGQQG